MLTLLPGGTPAGEARFGGGVLAMLQAHHGEEEEKEEVVLFCFSQERIGLHHACLGFIACRAKMP